MKEGDSTVLWIPTPFTGTPAEIDEGFATEGPDAFALLPLPPAAVSVNPAPTAVPAPPLLPSSSLPACSVCTCTLYLYLVTHLRPPRLYHRPPYAVIRSPVLAAKAVPSGTTLRLHTLLTTPAHNRSGCLTWLLPSDRPLIMAPIGHTGNRGSYHTLPFAVCHLARYLHGSHLRYYSKSVPTGIHHGDYAGDRPTRRSTTRYSFIGSTSTDTLLWALAPSRPNSSCCSGSLYTLLAPTYQLTAHQVEGEC